MSSPPRTPSGIPASSDERFRALHTRPGADRVIRRRAAERDALIGRAAA